MKKETKGLQKFTDFENLKTVEDFKALQEASPTEFEKSIEWLSSKLDEALKVNTGIDRYFNRLENSVCLWDNENLTSLKRDRWRVNESRIKNHIHKKLMENGYIPSINDISKETGLSRVTVSKHLTETNLSQFKNEQLETFKILNTNVLQRIYRIGMQTNDLKALRMFFQLTGGNIQLETVVNNNYIQVNNTKIDNAIINQLPIESREAIENIIIESKATNRKE
jgi:ribosomal protein S8